MHKDYSYLIGIKKGCLTAIAISREPVTDVTRKKGYSLRTMITAKCDCGSVFTCRASEYMRIQTCGCKSVRKTKRKYAKVVKKDKREIYYEPCTVNGVSLADYINMYREICRRENEKDTRTLFCHQVDTNIAIWNR